MQQHFNDNQILPAGTGATFFVRAGDRATFVWHYAGVVARVDGGLAVRFEPRREKLLRALWAGCHGEGAGTTGQLVVAFAVQDAGGAMVEIGRAALGGALLSEVEQVVERTRTVSPSGPADVRAFGPARPRSNWPPEWRLAGGTCRT